MPDPAVHTPVDQRLRFRSAAVLYFLSRFAIVAFVFAVPAIYFLLGYVEVPLVLGAAGLVTALLITYYLAVGGLRCAACANPVLIDNGKHKHPAARGFFGSRARVAWDILLHTNYQCMYCGTRCRCKKSWERAKFSRGTTGAPLQIVEPGADGRFPVSPFRNVAGLSDDLVSAVPLPQAEGELPFQENAATAPGFSSAASFHGESAPPLFIPDSGPVAPASKSVRIAAMSPVGHPTGAGNPPTAVPGLKPSSSVPGTFAAPAETPANEFAMNRPPTETHQPASGSNPFIAAAAAMPPPPGPLLPAIPGPNPAPAEPAPIHHGFPFSGECTTDSGGPPPWTLPSMPVSPGQAVAAVPVAPRSATPPQPPGMPAPATPPALQVDLFKHVVGTLEEGRRTLTNAFQSLIERLEAAFAASCPVPQPAIAPQPVIATQPVIAPQPVIAMQPVIAPHPVVATQPVIAPQPVIATKPVIATQPVIAPAPVITQVIELPSFLARSGPVAPPREKTTLVPPPAPTVREAPPSGAPLRRFARPSGLAARELSTVLNQIFEPAPPAPGGNGYASNNQISGSPAIIPSPRTTALESPFQAVPAMNIPPVAPRTPPPAEAAFSPFAVSSGPLASPDNMSGPPSPFTFLNTNDNQFAPAADAAGARTYDPLDDTALPWMKPLTVPAVRN